MDYSLLRKVIEQLEDYEKDHANGSIEEFVVWMNAKLFASGDEGAADRHEGHDKLLTAFKLLHVNKALKKAAKDVLASSEVSSIDEYSFLLHLEHQESFRKMEIIELHNLEAPTGIEIIKRLLRNGLVEDFDDPADKRAKRVRITQRGSKHLKTLQPKMDEVFASMIQPLALKEQILLNGVLDKLMQ
jgi:DNA-binding MarR family transcriptional regulator